MYIVQKHEQQKLAIAHRRYAMQYLKSMGYVNLNMLHHHNKDVNNAKYHIHHRLHKMSEFTNNGRLQDPYSFIKSKKKALDTQKNEVEPTKKKFEKSYKLRKNILKSIEEQKLRPYSADSGMYYGI